MEIKTAKEKFIQSWGNFGKTWGINKTMAQLHALLLVSDEPLSTEDAMERLQISRGNANMNIRALMDWGLVSKVTKMGDRKEYFEAERDVWHIARLIVRERRKREIEPMLAVIEELKEVSLSEVNREEEQEEKERFSVLLEDIDQFATKADSILDKFQRSDGNWFYRSLVKLMK